MKPTALLAPVPRQHLLSAQGVCARHGSVLFGSERYDVFAQGEISPGMPVYFYGSHYGDVPRPWSTRTGEFVRYLPLELTRGAELMRLRPPTTDTDTAWAGIYEVRNLRQPPKRGSSEIFDLRDKRGGTTPRFSSPKVPSGGSDKWQDAECHHVGSAARRRSGRAAATCERGDARCSA